MSRASGAMLTMTALQIATASLDVPKSVINTMIDLAEVPAGPGAPFSAGDFPHPQQTRAPAKSKTVKSRIRALIESPKFKCFSAKQEKRRGPSPDWTAG